VKRVGEKKGLIRMAKKGEKIVGKKATLFLQTKWCELDYP